MKKVTELYTELHEKSNAKLGDSHGLFITHKGDNTNESPILYVGRETRGLGTSINNTQLPITEFAEGDMFWLNNKENGYFYGTSPFWRTVGKSASVLSNKPYNYDIFETIYWANLYKIAPVHKGPNLKSTQNLQREVCIQLLIEEIKEIKPKCVIFLTGEWIDHFIRAWQKDNTITQPQKKDLGFYNSFFNFNIDNHQIPAIAIPHPQGKPEKPIVEAIINAMS